MRADLARSVRLFRAFRTEQDDGHGYYSTLAADTAAQLNDHVDLRDKVLLDVGGGPGYFAREFARHGARCVCVDVDAGEMDGTGGILGSALDLPLKGGVVDVCFSSNVLEHVPEPWRMASEMVRVTKPGGLIFLAYTNWLSPWGGHETSPWHYLGGRYAARKYQLKYGRPPKNHFGRSLYPISVAHGLRWARKRQDVELVDAFPRYLPWWYRPILSVPVVREFATWNLVLVLKKSK